MSKLYKSFENIEDILSIGNDSVDEQYDIFKKFVNACSELESGKSLATAILKGDLFGIIGSAWDVALENNIDPIELLNSNNQDGSKIYNSLKLSLSDNAINLLTYSLNLSKAFLLSPHGLVALNSMIPGLGVAFYSGKIIKDSHQRFSDEKNILKMLEKSAIIENSKMLESFIESIRKDLEIDDLLMRTIEKNVLLKTQEKGLRAELLTVNAFMNKEQKHDQFKDLLAKENIKSSKY